MENSIEIPQKNKKYWYDLAIQLLDVYPNKTKALTQKDIHASMFTAALFTIVKIWKQPKGPKMDEWIRKKCVCIQTMEYYSAIKKKEILQSVTV